MMLARESRWRRAGGRMIFVYWGVGSERGGDGGACLGICARPLELYLRSAVV